MPRIRTIKPEFFRSPSTAKASFPARILYEAMWCWADDYGIGETNVYGLLGFAFCDEDQITVSELQSLLKEVANAYDVTFYEVEKRHYFAVQAGMSTRRRSGRRDAGIRPPPTRDLPLTCGFTEALKLHSRRKEIQCVRKEIHSLEQGNRGTGEQGKKRLAQLRSATPTRPASTSSGRRTRGAGIAGKR
ncbi:hypothetical protein GS466_02340 [Rhodococcus hoagii]|nr:hypothetical protein [Prescottella equi]